MKLVYGPPQKYLCRENEVPPAAKNGFSDADELIIFNTFLMCRWFRFAQLTKGKKFRP